jgi:hypothetical protein
MALPQELPNCLNQQGNSEWQAHAQAERQRQALSPGLRKCVAYRQTGPIGQGPVRLERSMSAIGRVMPVRSVPKAGG